MTWLDKVWPFGRKSTYGSLDLLKEIYGTRLSAAGVSVNLETVLDSVTVLDCVRVLAEGVAQVPFKLFQQVGRNKNPARDHSLYRVLARRPNAWQTSFEYREMMMFHLALCFNHYSFINRVNGEVVELIPFQPNHVTVKRNSDYSLTYRVRTDSGVEQEFPQHSIWHVRGPSWNSYLGMDAIKLARHAIGLSMAIEQQQGGFFKNGAKVSGLYSVEGTLDEKQYKQLEKWIQDNYVKAEKAGTTMLLDRSAKFSQMIMSAVDSQTVEQRRYQVEEICRGFRVMPIMVGHSDKSQTYASSEQIFLAHVVHTLMPWYARLEQSAEVNLITEKEFNDGYYVKFIEHALLRGAMRDMGVFLRDMCDGGIMTRNEGRDKLDLNPLPGLDEPLDPVSAAQRPGRDKPTDKPKPKDDPEE